MIAIAAISKNIKQFRSSCGFTQDALAEKINVTRQTVSSWETGRTQPDVEMLELLSQALGVGIEEIIYGKKNKVGLEPEKGKDKKIFVIILSVFGALLTAVGLIILFVSLWEKLDRFYDVFAFMPFAAGMGVQCFALAKKKGSIAWKEAGAVAWAVGMIATNALLSSLHDADLGFAALMVIDSVAMIPIMFITGALFPLAGYYYMASHGFIALLEYAGNVGKIICIIMTTILIGIGFLFTKKFAGNDVSGKIMICLSSLAGAFNFISILSALLLLIFPATDSEAIIQILLCAVFTAGLFIEFRTYGVSFRSISAIGLSVISVVYPFALKTSIDLDYHLPVSISFIILAAMLALFITKNPKAKLCDYFLSAVPVLVFIQNVLIVICSGIGAKTEDFFAPTLILSMIVSIAIIASGVKNESLAKSNYGLIMLCGIILYLLFVSDIAIVFKGFACVAAGAIILAADKLLLGRFKKQEADENA